MKIVNNTNVKHYRMKQHITNNCEALMGMDSDDFWNYFHYKFSGTWWMTYSNLENILTRIKHD